MADSIQAQGWHYRYQLIDMHTLDCERFIHENNPDALVLAILCDFKGRDGREVVEGIIRRLIELIGSQPEKLRNYLKMLEILSTNRRLEGPFQEVESKMLREIDIEKLPSYQLGKGFGLEQGMKKVTRIALQQGISRDQIMLLP